MFADEESNQEVEPWLVTDAHPPPAARRSPRLGLAVCCGSLILGAWLFAPVSSRAKRMRPADVQRKDFFQEDRSCRSQPGVKFDEKEGRQLWPKCAAKWSEDCSGSGCCADPGMLCYEKTAKWSACLSTCSQRDAQNETWTCRTRVPVLPHTAEICTESCRLDETCQQAIFDAAEGGSCSLSTTRHSEIVWASDNFNSSVCGTLQETGELDNFMHQVGEHLPWTYRPAPLQTCSWAGEDCAATACCNEVACDKDFQACYPFSCYRKDQYFSTCRIEAPPPDWDGTWLGGGRLVQAVEPGGSQVLLQETSLYCFGVVNWHAPRSKPYWSTEAELADNIKLHGVSIMQCDWHEWYDSVPAPLGKWGSVANIQIFMDVWQQVKAKGNYKNYAWTVKVDTDAVFFPQRLKYHLDKLRTPRGLPVYLENNAYRFRFMGALEVMTREAVDLLTERGHECMHETNDGGEDYFVKSCLDALGSYHQSDLQLLIDKYAGQDGPCFDGWIAAFHFHKKVIDYNWCYNEAMCGSGDNKCGRGIDVPYTWGHEPGVHPAPQPALR